MCALFLTRAAMLQRSTATATTGETRRVEDVHAIRIACVGDSLTRGDGRHEPFNSFLKPSKKHILQKRGNYPLALHALGCEAIGRCVVRNFGHGGATASNCSDLPYESTREYKAALKWRPHVVVLMLGTNDAKEGNWESCGRTGAPTASGILRIAQSLRPGLGSGPPAALLLLEPARRAVRSAAALYSARTESVEGQVGRGARARRRCEPGGMWLLPFPKTATTRRSFDDDGIHFSRHGSTALATEVHRALRSAACPGVA